jgi:hypothetical protein
MKFGTKKLGGWLKRGAKKVGQAVDPANAAARAVDKAVDTFKDDMLILESRITIMGIPVGAIHTTCRLADIVEEQ